MSTTVLSLAEYRSLDKSAWTHDLIKHWNRRMGHMQKIPVKTGTYGYAAMTPSEQRQFRKQKKSEQRKPLVYVPTLAWEEVPQRLPYVFGSHTTNLDPTKVYVDSTFLDMAKIAAWKKLG